jgi:hypothetical protein
MLTVWTHYGRAPKYAEMDKPLSQIASGAYESKFGTWGRAKQAFVDRVNSDESFPQPAQPSTSRIDRTFSRGRSPAAFSLRLRWQVLTRDRLRCERPDVPPATRGSHRRVLPRLKTREDNLRTLCADRNIGKGAGD